MRRSHEPTRRIPRPCSPPPPRARARHRRPERRQPLLPAPRRPPVGLPRRRPARRGHGHRPDEADRQRRRRPRRARRGHPQGRPRRAHRRLLRAGRQGQRLVPRRGDDRVRERQAGVDRRLVRGRRRRRAGRDRHARPPEGRHALPPGVLQGPRRGQGEDRLAARAREGPAQALPQHADDARDQPARARHARGEVLCARRRRRARRRPLRRRRPRGADRYGQAAEPGEAEPAAEQQQHEPAAGERDRDLALLLLRGQPRAEVRRRSTRARRPWRSRRSARR